MLLRDEPRRKIKGHIFRTIQHSTRTIKPCSFRFLSLFHSSYVRNIRYNDSPLPRVKITRLTTIGISWSVTTVLCRFYRPRRANPQRTSTRHVLKSPFSIWFEAYKHFDKDYRALSYSKTHSFLILLVRWCQNRQRVKDNYLLMQQETQTSGEGRWRRARDFPRTRSFRPLCLKCGRLVHCGSFLVEWKDGPLVCIFD
ncbi:hypothetical protein EDD85DRAFT_523211 [Armillaria nabsnona]|nr:hypothetical protein EDD85DRAFT_523211 [Armillaria nabsnona]